MAGTDKRQRVDLAGPRILLIDPQLGQNIGMVARAMLNCGLSELALVRPRDGWPNREAQAAASGAEEILAQARLFDTTEEAVADLRRVYAMTARPRDMVKPVATPRQAALDLRRAVAAGEAVGVLFGPERSGLTNDDLALAERIVSVPLNPGFSSLNLAQAVLLLGYEWFQAGDDTPGERLVRGRGKPAPKAELTNFFARLERSLDEVGFFHPPEKRAGMVRNLRNLFQRAELSDAEVRTLHGVVSSLRAGKRGPS